MNKMMQVIVLAALLAGSAELGASSPSGVCHYGLCHCDVERQDDIQWAGRVRDKRLGNCADALCVEGVLYEYRERLYQIEANYHLCLYSCMSRGSYG